MTEQLKILELFAGTQSISKVFRANGWQSLTLDFDAQFADSTDLLMDVLELTPEMVLEKLGKPDVIWASPPCTKFSVASCYRNWTKTDDGYEAKSEDAELALKIVEHTLYLIQELQPKYWFIENPRGMLRKMPIMHGLPRHTVTYCQYGDNRMKPTDLWTNHTDPKFKLPCKNGMPCHVSAPRGSQTGTQGLKNARDRAVIPVGLCEHIHSICTE